MWLLHFIVLILRCFYTRSIETSKCKEPQTAEYNQTTTMDHLEYVATNHSMSSCLTLTSLNRTADFVNHAAIARSIGPNLWLINSCRELRYTGQALLQLPNQLPPFWVLCVQQHQPTGSGWLVIQQRVSGQENFFRPWAEYRDGFGSLGGEFWQGLENIHQITKLQQYELLVEMADFKGNYKFARYARFEIDSADEEYALNQLGFYFGTAGDSLRPHVGMKFSTYDNDNDNLNGLNCALENNAGWWFDKCFVFGSNLNGKYTNSEANYSMSWFGFNSTYTGLRHSRMMLRTVN